MTDSTITDAAMTAPHRAAIFGSRLVRPAFRFTSLLLIVCLIVAVGVVAIGSGTGLVALPYQMFELKSRAPFLFPAHMVASAMALLLAPAVILARRHRDLHRPLGFLLGVFVVIGGLTALPVAVLSHSSLPARAGFFVQALVWLYLLGAAFRAIRRRDIRRHADMMIAMLAVMSGAIWFRLMTGTAIAIGLPFEPVYAFASWAGWMLPFALVRRHPALVSALLAR